MTHFFRFIAASLLLVGNIFTTQAAEQLLAFPEAQGFGRFATGGRYGSVYMVTNLNDSGSGSLRDAVSQPNRIVVFKVAGVIKLQSRLVFKNNLYVAGQTAPGEGVTVYGNGVSFSGASNSIIRHMRFRMGKGGDAGKDCAGIANGTNIIIDHCSFAWGLDETFSINPDGKGDIGNITLSNCIVGQGLLTHSAGGLMQADNITLYRNLYCDNSTRNNKVKGKHQYVNNIVYNWSNGCYIMGGDSEGESFANTTGNLFINGPSGGGNACTGANADFHIYIADNWQDKNKNGELDPYEIPQSEYSGGPTFESTPFNHPELQSVSATSLITDLLPSVGASLPYRDYTDCYMIDEVMSFGKKGGLISTEAVLPYGTPDTWNLWTGMTQNHITADSDADGVPDYWETACGTDPLKNDAMEIASNGYTNIENYINNISRNDREFFLRKPLTPSLLSSTTSTLTIGWADYTDNEDGFIVQRTLTDEEKAAGNSDTGAAGNSDTSTTDSDWLTVATTAPNSTSYKIEGLEPGTAYSIRIVTYIGEENIPSYAVMPTGMNISDVIECKTRPLEAGIIDIDTYEGETTELADEKNVLIDTDENIDILLNTAIAPKAVVVKGSGDVNIKGDGEISGSASMNKAGTGTLTLSTTNSYTGATVLHEGSIAFNTLKNGGEKSSLGASQEFAQNWVWNGGTWNYTGGSTTTNRSAKLLQDTRFSIDDANATVAMSGQIQGNGNFILSGKGKLQPSSSAFFAYNGDTYLEGGKLYLNGVSTLWTDKQCHLGSSNKLVLAGGALETKDANDTYATYDFDIEAIKDTYSSLQFHRNCSIKSRVYGEGCIEMKVTYLREYITGNWDDFTGRLYVNSTTGKSGEQQFMLFNGTGIKNGVIELKGANTQIVGWKASATYYLGGLSGDKGTYLSGFSKNTKTSVGTWVVGGANTDEHFYGIIDNRCSANNYNGTVNIIKEGNGQWWLYGDNIYSGTTTVNGGMLAVNGKHSGTGKFTVNDGATLSGTGTIAAPVEIKSGATLSSTNQLTINGKLTMNQDSRILFHLGYSLGDDTVSHQCINLKDADVSGAILELNTDDVETDLEPYLTLQLFNPSTTIKGQFAKIIPAEPAGDLCWDTSLLYTNGILKTIPKSSAVTAPTSALSNNQPTYNLKGQKVNNNYKGIIIKQGKTTIQH